jgi:acylphosphatase
MIKCLSIKISGKVQGVGFRYFALDAARKTGINGYVRNETDGTVFIEAEGTQEQLDIFISLCRKGPGRSMVTNIVYQSSPVMGHNSFIIR